VEFDAQDANFGQITGTVGKSGGRSFQGSLRLQF